MTNDKELSADEELRGVTEDLEAKHDLTGEFLIRAVIQRAALSYSTKQIAREFRRPYAQINQILGAPSVKAEVRRIQDQMFMENHKKPFQAFSAEAFGTLVKMLRSSKTKESVKAEIAFKMFDRGFGKATQHIEQTTHLLAEMYNKLDETFNKPKVPIEAVYSNIDKQETKDADVDPLEGILNGKDETVTEQVTREAWSKAKA